MTNDASFCAIITLMGDSVCHPAVVESGGSLGLHALSEYIL